MTKYALVVGINEYPSAPLSGCVNDAADWSHVLLDKGYQVTSLIDSSATLENIKSHLRTLITEAGYRDRVVFQFSGHGTWVRDASGDEPDSRDEAICPVDCFDNGMLYDDEIGSILGSRRYGVRVLQISDSCHSGSVSRLMPSAATGTPRFIPAEALPKRVKPSTPRTAIGKGNVLMAGCLDTEFSYDAWFHRRANGAFTRAAIDALAHQPKSYRMWQAMIRAALPSDQYPQTPQLEASLYRSQWTPLA